MPETIDILGVPVSIVDMPVALETIEGWIAERRAGFVCLRDVHGVMLCQKDEALMRIHKDAGMVAPDGMPLVWFGRLLGARRMGRVCGPDLMPALCERSLARGTRHFFYGGGPGVAERLAEALRARFSGLAVAGTFTPPFRPLTGAEDAAAVRAINASKADIVWVGLSVPPSRSAGWRSTWGGSRRRSCWAWARRSTSTPGPSGGRPDGCRGAAWNGCSAC